MKIKFNMLILVTGLAFSSVSNAAPLYEANMSMRDIIEWTTKTVSKTLSFNGETVDESLSSHKKDYTEAALNEIASGLKENGVLDRLETKNSSVEISIDKYPVISNHDIKNDIYEWQLEFPITINYEIDQKVTEKQGMLVTVVVERVSDSKNPEGIDIKSFSVRKK